MTIYDLEQAAYRCGGVLLAVAHCDSPPHVVRVYVMGGAASEVATALCRACPEGFTIRFFHAPDDALTESDL